MFCWFWSVDSVCNSWILLFPTFSPSKSTQNPRIRQISPRFRVLPEQFPSEIDLRGSSGPRPGSSGHARIIRLLARIIRLPLPKLQFCSPPPPPQPPPLPPAKPQQHNLRTTIRLWVREFEWDFRVLLCFGYLGTVRHQQLPLIFVDYSSSLRTVTSTTSLSYLAIALIPHMALLLRSLPIETSCCVLQATWLVHVSDHTP